MSDQTIDRTSELRDVATQVVELARKAGAREAEAFVERSRQASATVREGEIEELSEASSKGIGLRVIVGGRLGFAATTDLNSDALKTLVSRAIALAKEAAPDEANALPTAKELSLKDRPRVERLYDDAVANLDPGWKLRVAFEMERAARAADPRCNNFEGSGAGESVSEYAIASSHGLVDSERGTYAYLWCAPVARDGDSLQTSSWSDYKRFLSELDTPGAIGREAAHRTVRMLGARKVESARVPVVFDPMMAAGFVGSLASATSGDLVYKRASFLTKSLNKAVAASLVTLVDDARIPGALGSGAFDGEGVPTRRLPLIEAGIVRNFLYDMRTARKAGTRTTGHAQRGYSSLPSIGPTNLRLEPGATSPEEIIRGVRRGLYVTTMLGRGANVVTGDYSRGANGLWIENGELTFPVQEVTVAGNLTEMLMGIDAVGSDLVVRGSVGAPTIRFAELAVGGR
jgi:PmbA protein